MNSSTSLGILDRILRHLPDRRLAFEKQVNAFMDADPITSVGQQGQQIRLQAFCRGFLFLAFFAEEQQLLLEFWAERYHFWI